MVLVKLAWNKQIFIAVGIAACTSFHLMCLVMSDSSAMSLNNALDM